MAAYEAERSVHRTLEAGTEDIVTLTRPEWGRVEIINFGPGRIYYLLGADTVEVAADDTFVVPPNSTDKVGDISVATETVAHLISDAACEYAVIGYPAES